MKIRWSLLAVVLLAPTILFVSACSGGSSEDQAKVKGRVQAFFDHMNAGDGKAWIGDLDPSVRASCKEDSVRLMVGALKLLKWELKQTDIKSIRDNKAEVHVTVLEGNGKQDKSRLSLVKADGDWFVDTEGKGCTFGGGSAQRR